MDFARTGTYQQFRESTNKVGRVDEAPRAAAQIHLAGAGDDKALFGTNIDPLRGASHLCHACPSIKFLLEFTPRAGTRQCSFVLSGLDGIHLVGPAANT